MFIHTLLRATLFGLLVLHTGCSRATDENTNTENPKLDWPALQEGLNPTYKTPAGVKQECLGRQVFDAPWPLVWRLRNPNSEPLSFRDALNNWGGLVKIAPGYQIAVQPMTAEQKNQAFAQFYESQQLNRKNIVRGLHEDNEQSKRQIKHLTALLSKEKNEQQIKRLKEAIKDYEKETSERNAELLRLSKTPPFNVESGLPDTIVGQGGRLFTSLMWRNGWMYVIADYSDSEASLEQRTAIFLEFLRRFRHRQLYEIPTERGICIPYGFIPDDGTLTYSTNLDFRWADHPNVLYTFETGTVTRLGSETTWLDAATYGFAGEGTSYEAEIKKRLIKKIGPRGANIGGLRGEQGGAAVNLAEPGQTPIENYIVFTGYGGYAGSQILPFVKIMMRSLQKKDNPILTTNPPPFAESESRLERFLKSVRFRPTDKPMPEQEKIRAN